MFEFVAELGDKRRRFGLPGAGVVVAIGAAPENDWVLPFEGVSRRHATAELVEGDQPRLLLRDTGSKNGLVDGGQRVPEVVLGPGSAVRCGRVTLRLELVVDDPVVPMAPLERLVSVAKSWSTSTPLVALDPGEDAAVALAFVRALAARAVPIGRGRQEALEALQRLVGADCVLIVQRPRLGGLAVGDLAGAMPSEVDLALLEKAVAGKVHQAAATSRSWLVAGSGPHGSLAALVPERAAAAEWRELVLLCTAERLLGPQVSSETEVEERGWGTSHDPLRFPPGMVVGRSVAFGAVLDELRKTAAHGRAFLLLGETGVGKEPIARLLHYSKPGTRGPWVAANMASLPSELVDAELFGIEDRVASGVGKRRGLFEQAAGGTLFLDEIGDLPPSAQAKLLRVLQDGVVRRVGGEAKGLTVDVRVVAATNHDLPQLIAQERFRADLYYRLAQVVVRVPPLRERREDIPALALAFAHRQAAAMGKHVLGIRERALAVLEHHSWPGNVRQLERAVEYAVMACAEGGAIGLEDLPRDLEEDRGSPLSEGTDFDEQAREVERRRIEDALVRSGGNNTRAAELLGISREAFRLRRKRCGLL